MRFILFWVIPRQSTDTDHWNVELVETEVSTIVATEFNILGLKSSPMTEVTKVTVPCIVNMKAIGAGEQVILKMALEPKAKAKATQSGRTWFETIQQQESKRLRTSKSTVVE